MSARRLRFGLPTVLGLAQARLLHPLSLCRPGAGTAASARPTWRSSRSSPRPSRRSWRCSSRWSSLRRRLPGDRRRAAAGAALEPGLVPAPRRGRALHLRARDAPAPHRRGRLRPFDALHGARRPRRRACERDHCDRPGAARRHRGHRRDAHPRHVQGAGLGAFEKLAEGDILFIDSSHILMPGTDVDMLLNHVLPALPRGVLVHVHDIFLPDDYPLGMGVARLQRAARRRGADPGRRLPAPVVEPLRGDAHGGGGRREPRRRDPLKPAPRKRASGW